MFTLGFVASILYYYAFFISDDMKTRSKSYFYDEKNPDVFENFRWPILVCSLAIIGFGSTHFPDSWIKRPHPAFWRTLLGVFLCYALFMTLVFLLPLNEARWIFKLFHPSFG